MSAKLKKLEQRLLELEKENSLLKKTNVSKTNKSSKTPTTSTTKKTTVKKTTTKKPTVSKTTKPVAKKTTPTAKKTINKNKVLISARDIKKTYGKQQVLKGVSFDLYEGEVLAIVGANGAGKTVLMETIAGLIVRDSGEVNYEFEKTAESYKEEIGVQFQDSKMPPGYTVQQLVKLFLNVYRDRIDESEFNKMLDLFKVRDFYKKKAAKLSGGQKQRLNLLLAIMHKPKIMILDEFITGLDINSVIDIIDYIKKLKEEINASLIIITHQPQEIEEMADRVIVLKNGEFVEELKKSEIRKKYKTYREFMRSVI